MQAFAIVLIVQIIIGGLFLHTSLNSPSAKIVRHSLRQVLGASLLAQNDSSSTTDQPTDTPTPDQSSQDTLTPDQSQPTDTPVPNGQSQQPIETPTDTPTPSQPQIQTPMTDNQPSLAPGETSLVNTSDTITNPAPSGELTPTPSASDNLTGTVNTPTATIDTPTPTPENQDTGTLDTNTITIDSSPVEAAIVNSDTTISTPSDISPSSIQQAQQQDTEIQKTAGPQQQTVTLLEAAKENVISINDTVQQSNYSTESFLTQRVTDEISKAVTNAQNQTTQQNNTLSDVKLFCKQADLTLKTQQLLVPQDLEQDIEIARGLCSTIQ